MRTRSSTQPPLQSSPQPVQSNQQETLENPTTSVMQRFDFGEKTSTPAHQPLMTQTSTAPQLTGKLCEPFTGSDALTRVEDWIVIFEITTRGWTDADRITAVCRHLSGEAMRWLVREIAPLIETMTWTQFKHKIQIRFGRPTRNHLEEAFERLQRPGETMESYFNEKRRLLTLAGQDNANQVALLSRVLHDVNIRNLIRVQLPETPEQRLKIALQIEQPIANSSESKPNEGQTHANEDRREEQKFENRNKTRFQIDFSKPPTTPCPVCKAFRDNQLHWKKDCPRLKQQHQQLDRNPPTIVVTPEQSNMVVSPFVTFDIRLNGHRLRPFLDSGSTITAISKSTADRLNLQWDARSSIPLSHIAGITETLGTVDANIEFHGQTFRMPIHVLKHFKHEMLIGVDLARKAKLTVTFDENATQDATSTLVIAHQNSFMNHVSPQDSLLDRTDDFVNESNELGRLQPVQHKIRLMPNAVPVNRPFRISAQREKEFQKQHETRLMTHAVPVNL